MIVLQVLEQDSEGSLEWIKNNWEQDAFETIQVLNSQKKSVDWLIVDHYGLDINWEKNLKQYVNKILVIDDLADRSHYCDVLVDQTFGEDGKRYKKLIPDYTIGLFGVNYAILRPQFREHRKSNFVLDENNIEVHLFFGGIDRKNFTEKFSKLLLDEFSNINICAVVGKNYNCTDSLTQLSRKYKERFSWEQNIFNMAEHMSKCDIAIGAAGTATWERACVGLPSGYLIISKNQKKILEKLHQNELCVLLGDAEFISDQEFITAISLFIRNKKDLRKMFLKGKQCISGLGSANIVDTMLSLRG
ncbi:UDP-2,4-diacetamido-2,4,6-trideoxy-beta-L-altropyranose hydrolase [Jeotgalibacillus terrae]|nr:UDP-2,4-diacetamido-2,4,6-trideoxy-beta-L-altropyranose hydrolase [Jeotgalibacillus terrae]